MTDLACSRLSAIACGTLLLAATAMPTAAQIRIDRDQTGQTVAITGLPGSSGCVRGVSTGRVVDRVVEKGELQGFTFNEPPYDDSYINLPAAYDIKDRAAYRRLQAAFDDLFRKGARLKISSVACGAAGRIVKLVSATLLDDAPPPKAAPVAAPAPAQPAAPPAPATAIAAGDTGVKTDDGDDSVLRAPDGPAAPAVASAAPAAARPDPERQVSPEAAAPRPTQPNRRSRWRLSQPSTVQVNLEIRSNDRAFGFTLDCMRTSGRIRFSNWFLPPRDWNIAKSATPISIDGRPLRWEVGGADEGMVFSDSVVDNTVALSANALSQLARGERLVVGGKTDRGRTHDAVFDIAGGEETFAAFEARCQKLPRR